MLEGVWNGRPTTEQLHQSASLRTVEAVLMMWQMSNVFCMLQVITEAAEAGNPLLFFCRVGKDRTGVLAALLLSCCGATPDEIIADYHRSASWLACPLVFA